MSYERMEIVVECRAAYGGEICGVVIPAYCYGPLAIHHDRENPNAYTITHLVSGWAIKDGLSLHNAHRMVQRALAIGFDWTQDLDAINAIPRGDRMAVGRSLLAATVEALR